MLNTMIWVWLAIAAIAAFVEAATMSLVSTWFALGALAAAFAAYFGGSLTVQAAVFVFVALLTLLLARPLAKRFIDPKIVPTNADRVIGMIGRVEESIDSSSGSGTVRVDGKVWTACSEDDSVIPADAQVEVCRLQGIKLIVRPTSEAVVEIRS